MKISFLVLTLFISACSYQQANIPDNYSDIFPDKYWDIVDDPAVLGYSLNKLVAAEKYSEGINTAAVVIIVNGKILYEWGEVSKKYKTHSLRKSLLSAMYGNYVKNGTIDLDVTMGELGINDEPPLSDEELMATIRDCLKARSGIYHPALYESPGMKALKPERFTEKAGAHWYYNNWDFNVAGTIFKNATGKDIYEAIERDLAKPIQMESFSASDGEYVTGEESIHPAYPFRITAHDLGRFGLLMLNKGNWNGNQVVPADWVEESTRYHSDAALYSSAGYGYMWWVSRNFNKFPHLPNVTLPEGTYSARGAGGHYLLIIPAYNMVIVHRVDTDVKGNRAASRDVGKLISMIIEAKS